MAGFPKPRPLSGGLWAGPRYRGLLLTDARRRGVLYYGDCEHFEAKKCPPTMTITSEPACETRSWRGLDGGGYRYRRVRGAVVATYNRLAATRVISGDAITSISRDANGYALDVVRALRPYGARRARGKLPAPRVPRALLPRLEPELRAALRPYRVC
jgi:hypothetical protein